MSPVATATPLLSADAVRSRAQMMLAAGLDGRLEHFRVDLSRLDDAAERVRVITLARYPDLDVPFHSRWRHFCLAGEDRWAALALAPHWRDAGARARAAFDLAIISVLLDAGAGNDWRWRDPLTGAEIGRSEGLGLASLAMFVNGAFSADPADPLRADAAALGCITAERLAEGFQVTTTNPLVGLEGRTALLRRLGEVIAAQPDVFAIADRPRPGGLFDHLAAAAAGGNITAPAILAALLRHFGPLWPSRLALAGVPLGDCWRHPAVVTGDATSGYVPLHKLSQWLAYSLIEPLMAAGLRVTGIDGLTGLAEYRNGGLFIDTGVLVLRDRAEASRAHDVASTLVVEWRALTVALLDRLATALRLKLGLDTEALPLAKVLEGGTWAAGRVLAWERRGDGAPPLRVVSDGTVF